MNADGNFAPRRERIKSRSSCKVCGDRSSGKHYGVLTCDGCRGFFKRSVRRSLSYNCKNFGECVVDVTRRNQCQACRLKKCFEVEMNPDAVQHERAPRSISKGKSLLIVSTNGLGSSRGNRRKAISKTKHEKDQLSSEPNSPYSSPRSPEQFNELESSADTVFPTSCFTDPCVNTAVVDCDVSSNGNTNGDGEIPRDIQEIGIDNASFALYGKYNGHMQCFDMTGKSIDGCQIANTTTQGDSAVNDDDKSSSENSKDGNDNQADVTGTNINNQCDKNNNYSSNYYNNNNSSNNNNNNKNNNRNDNNNRNVTYRSTNGNHNKYEMTDAGHFSEHAKQVDMWSRAVFSSSSFPLYDSSMQLLYMSVRWARNIPMFMDLPFRDQAILLEEAWSELFILSAVQYSLPVDMTTLSSASQSGTPKIFNEIRVLQNVVARFNQLQMNTVEYACLKAVVLFKSDLRGLRAPHDIERLQDQAQTILNDYCQTHVSTPDNARFGKLLLTLPLLRSVNPKMIEQVFFCRDGDVISIERILCDMFKAC